MILNCIHSVISTISEVDEALLGVLYDAVLYINKGADAVYDRYTVQYIEKRL